MVIELIFKNHRSIRDEQSFSLEAGVSKIKPDNFFHIKNGNNDIKLLKSTVIYGPNASGKTNLIRLIYAIRFFVLNSIELKTGDLIPGIYYDPFLLDKSSSVQPTEFSIDFIAFNKKRHQYSVKFDRNEIIYEYLGVYESSRISKIFERNNSSTTVEFGDGMENK